MKLSARKFMIIVLAAILACSSIGLLPRLALEKENRNVAVVVDYRDIPPLAQGAGCSVNEALVMLKKKGLGGLMVGEFTGEDILGGLGPLEMSPAVSRSDGAGVGGQGTLFSIPVTLSYAPKLASLLAMRAGTQPVISRESIGVVYPAAMDALRKSGLVPDLEGLNAGTEAKIPLFYRVAPAQTWQMRQALEVTRKVLADYPAIAVVAPSGEIALGYPDLKPLASLLKERNIPVAMIEFSRQLGAPSLNWLAFPNLIPLHSVTNEELLARNIERGALHERLVRAAIERSVRLLVLRPAVSGNVNSALEAFGQELESLSSELKERGLKMEWPAPQFADGGAGWKTGYLSALACSMALVICISRYTKRMTGLDNDPQDIPEMLCFFVLACLLGAAVWKVSAVARLTGALTSAFVVTEASLLAMDDPKRLWRSLSGAFVFAVIGGLAVAALFSEPVYMLRLKAFSGVKLTLMLPPLLVLLHDMRRRIHPESLSDLLSRPPLYGELFLVLVLLVLMALILFRSDNVQFIPGLEAKMRNTLERLLIARPRNKEVFIGYPCLLLYAMTVSSGLWSRYREVLRLGVAVGFSSVVNSFCHFHTPLFFILLREFHGLWVGVLFGILTVLIVKYAVLPVWNRVRFVTE